jgi:hypothetical protein
MVNAYDPAGNLIAGPYVDANGAPVTIALASSNAPHAPITPTSLAASGATISVAYDGAATTNPTITASAPGVQSAAATLTLVAASACQSAPTACVLYAIGGLGKVVPFGTTGTLPLSGFNPGSSTYDSIAVNAQGSVALGGFNNLLVGRVSSAGTTFTTTGGFSPSFNGGSYVSGLAFDPAGLLYISQVAAPLSNKTPTIGVNVYSQAAYSAPVTYASPTATLAGSATTLSAPGDLAYQGGLLYVRDVDAIKAFASFGNVAPVATISNPNAGLVRPIDVTSDPSGNVYVLYANDYRPGGSGAAAIARYPAGSPTISNVITNQLNAIGGQLASPTAIAADALGNVFVAETVGAIGAPNPQTSIVEYVGTTNAAPTASFSTGGTIVRGASVVPIANSPVKKLFVDAAETVYAAENFSSERIVAFASVGGGPFVPTRDIGDDNGVTSKIGILRGVTVAPDGTLFVRSQAVQSGVDGILAFAPGADCVRVAVAELAEKSDASATFPRGGCRNACGLRRTRRQFSVAGGAASVVGFERESDREFQFGHGGSSVRRIVRLSLIDRGHGVADHRRSRRAAARLDAVVDVGILRWAHARNRR